MNHIYRVVFNRSLGVYQCVSELAKAQGKSSGRSAIIGKRSSFIVSSLSIAILSTMAANVAQAAIYNSGNTQPLSGVYKPIDDVITGQGTVLKTDSTLVGDSDNGVLRIQESGKLKNAGYMAVGSASGASGQVTVTGLNSQITTDALDIGIGGESSVIIEKGGKVLVGDRVNIFSDSAIGNLGSMTVTGFDSKLATENIFINGGTLNINDSGKVNTSKFAIGTGTGIGANDLGELKVNGNDSKLIVNDNLYVGDKGKGSVTIEAGGEAKIDNDIYVGSAAGSEGNLTVTGVDSKLVSGDDLYVGDEGKGSVTIEAGGEAKIDNDIYVGSAAGSEGNLTVTGVDSKLVSGDDLYVGDEGKGSVTIEAGGEARIDDDIYVGSAAGGEGNLTVTGVDSKLVSGDDLYVGDEGKGSVTIEAGGIMRVNGIRISNESSTIVTGTDSKIVAQNILVNDNSNLKATNGGELKTDRNISVFNSDLTVTNGSRVNTGQDMLLFNSNLTATNGGELKTDRNMSVFNSDLTVTNGGELKTDRNMSLFNSELTVANGSRVNTDQNIFVSSSTLTVSSGAQINTNNIAKIGSARSAPVIVNFDNGTLRLTGNSPSLFNNFTSSDAINLGDGGGTIDTNGNDAILFNNAVINGAGSFTKAGAGTLTMNTGINKAWTGTTNINQGVLQLNGDYTMAEGEVLGIGLNSLDNYGQLVVNGSADITEGQLNVNASEAVQRLNGATVWNDIVRTSNLIGNFESVTDNSQLVGFVADYSTPNAVNLVMVRQNKFVDTIQSQANRTGLSLAGVLDRSIDNRLANNNDEFADTLISSTIGFDQPQIAAAVNELQPLLMGASNRIVTDANIVMSNAITDHSLSSPKRGLWAQALSSNINQDEEDGVTGYDADSYGGIVGIDAPINSNLNLGMAVSYNDSDVDSKSQNHKMSAKSWQVLGYGNYDVSDATQVNFHAGAGRSNIEGERQLSILTDAVAQSDYDVDTLQAGFGIGHRIGAQDRNITPFAQVNYAQAKSDSYRETGDSAYNFEVDENTYESMRWTAGIKLSQALTPKVALTGQLAAAIENGDQRSDITASFISVPDDKFTTVGQEVSQEIGIAGIGVSYMPTANMTLSAGYRGEWRDNYDDQGGNVALQIAF